MKPWLDHIKANLGAIQPSGDFDPSGRHVGLIYYPYGRTDLASAWATGLEVELLDGDRVVAQGYGPIDTHPPRSLLVPTSALVATDAASGVWPTLPRDLDRPGGRQVTRTAWSLARRGVDGSPLTTAWPAARGQAPKLELSTTSPDSSILVLGPGSPLPSNPVALLRDYEAVLIDASVPTTVRTDRSLGPADDAAGTLRYVEGMLHHAGGLAAKSAAPLMAFDDPATQAFLDALRGYYEGGGTVLLIGSSRSSWGPEPTSGLNLRALLKRLEPGRDLSSNWTPRPAASARRVILAYDDSQSAADGDLPASRYPTLPLLTLAGDRKDLSAVSAPKRKEWIASAIAQLRQRLGKLDVTLGMLPQDGLAIPGRSALVDDYIEELGLAGADLGGDEEFRGQIAGLLDSKSELGFRAVRWLREQLAHPELAVESQGRPVFRYGRRDGRDLASPPLPGDEPSDWAFQEPFKPRAKGDRPAWRDRLALAFESIKNPTATPSPNLRLRPELASNSPIQLLDGVEFATFAQYLAAEVVRQGSSAAPPPGGPSADALAPSQVVLGIFDGGDAIDQPSDRARFPLLDATKGLVRETRSWLALTPARGQHFLFLGGPKPSLDGPVSKVGRDRLVDPADDAAQPEWWCVTVPTVDASQGLLREGRGRYFRLLAHALARDIQAIPCVTTPQFLRDAEVRGIPAESVDRFRRLVHERLRLSFTTPWRPRTVGTPAPDWTPLVSALTPDADPEPVVLVARHPGGQGGTLLLVMADPDFEHQLHQLRGDYIEDWEDFSEVTRFPESATGPSGGGPPPLAADAFRTGARLHAALDAVKNVGQRVYQISFHPIDATTIPPVIDTTVPKKTSLTKLEVRLRPYLGLLGAPAEPLRLHQDSTDKARITLSDNPGDQQDVQITDLVEGVQIVVSDHLAEQLAAAQPLPAVQRPPNVIDLTPLIEVEMQLANNQSAVRVWFPLAQSEARSVHFRHEDTVDPPVARLVDTLVEMFGRRPLHRLEVLEDRRSFRLVPEPGNRPVPRPIQVRFLAPDGITQRPSGWFSPGLAPPGQLIFQARRDEAFGQEHLVALSTRKAGIDVPLERHWLYLPGPPGDWPAAGPAFAAPLLPDEGGGADPRPSGLVLDTLATVSRSDRDRDRLEAESREDPGRTWGDHDRGVIVSPIHPQNHETLERFALGVVDARTRTRHSRRWYLVALAFLVLGVLAPAVSHRLWKLRSRR
jgi:hypothetical protein